MVIFITKIEAYSEMEEAILKGDHPVWLSYGVLEQQKIELLWSNDIDLSVFDYKVNAADTQDLECALDTIREHHPGQEIWYKRENRI